MRVPDELRQPTALRLLTIWRECGVAAEEPVERALLCNACVLAESCFYQGEPVFANGEEVLSLLTAREMESLLQQLADGQVAMVKEENPAFDPAQYERLREE